MESYQGGKAGRYGTVHMGQLLLVVGEMGTGTQTFWSRAFEWLLPDLNISSRG